MSTDLVPVDQYAIVQKGAGGLELLRETLEGQDVNEFSLSRVKIPAGGGTTWEVPTLQGVEGTATLEGVVVFSKQSRAYWESAYKGGNEPPDCSSPNGKLARAREGIEIPAPRVEGDPSGLLSCDGCAYAEFGSSDKGSGRAQACKQMRQLFLIVPDRMLPLVVSLPPTSLKRAANYFLMLADYQKDYKRIVTKISLEKTSGQEVPDYSIAIFEAGQEVDDETAALLAEYAAALKPHFEAVRVETASEVGA